MSNKFKIVSEKRWQTKADWAKRIEEIEPESSVKINYVNFLENIYNDIIKSRIHKKNEKNIPEL